MSFQEKYQENIIRIMYAYNTTILHNDVTPTKSTSEHKSSSLQIDTWKKNMYDLAINPTKKVTNVSKNKDPITQLA